MKKSYCKKDYISYFVIYTMVFTSMIILLFYRFWQDGLSFVWKVDGWAQHIHALQFYSDWLQQIVRNLFFKHRLEVPLWSFSIGYGSDIMTTLHYYVIGDPFCFFSVFVPDQYMVHFYDMMILFRMYLAGISFSVYCFYKKRTTKIAVLTGAVLYVFSTYILIMGFHHPFFINSFIYLPFLLIGIEKILEDKSPALFIFIVFICTVSNFYFMYMIALNAVLYLFIRMFSIYGIKNIKQFLNKLVHMILYAITGVLMGAFIFLPILNLFANNSRDGSGQPFQLLYEKTFYQDLPKMLIAVNRGTHHTMLAVCSIVLCCVYLLCIKRKENTEIKIGLLILTLCLLIPAAGKVFNGFSYASNRWMFSYIFLLSYIVVIEWDALFAMKKKAFAGIFLIMAGLLAYNYYILGENFKTELSGYTSLIGFNLLIVGISSVLSRSRFRQNKTYFTGLQLLMCVLVVMTIHLNTQNIFYKSNDSKRKTEFASIEHVRKDLRSPADKAISKAVSNDDSFFRYESNESLVERNSTLQSKLHSTNFYWSLSGKLPAQLFSEMALVNKGAYNYKNLDGRTFLNEIASTKYYVTPVKKNGNYVVPFGYKKFGTYKIKTARRTQRCTVFENKYALPLGYTYDSYYVRNDYEKMNELERQNALLQGVLLEKKITGYARTAIDQNYVKIPYQIKEYNGVKRNGNRFIVQRSDGSIVLETKKTINKSELNLFIGNISTKEADKVADDNSGAAKYVIITQNSDGRTSRKRLFYFQPKNIYYAARKHFMVNLGYYNVGKQRIIVHFPNVGQYKIGSVKLYAQSMAGYSDKITKLKENTLKNIKIGTNNIKGSIHLSKNKILCLSVPYSKGWRAVVDGKKQELLQANTMYMALPLKKGNHKIQLFYRTPGLEAGIILSFGGWFLYAIVLVYEKKNKGKHSLANQHSKSNFLS